MNKSLFGKHFKILNSILLFLTLLPLEVCAGENFGVSGKKVPGFLPLKSDGLGFWLPLPRKPQTKLMHTKTFKTTFESSLERVPLNDLKGNWELYRWLEEESAIPQSKFHHEVGMGGKSHMSHFSNKGKMDHSIQLNDRSKLVQSHGFQSGGHREGMKNSLQQANSESRLDSVNHSGGLGSQYLAQLQRLTTLQLYPGMAMGISLMGQGPEMWAQYQIRSNACLTFDLRHEQLAPQARLSLAMDI